MTKVTLAPFAAAALSLLATAAPALAQKEVVTETRDPNKNTEQMRLERMHPVERIRREAAKAIKLVTTDTGQMYLVAANWLPIVSDRTVFQDKGTRHAVTLADFEAMPQETQPNYSEVKLDATFYYYTRYGSPLAYSRPFDLLAAQVDSHGNWFANKRILDFGVGGIAPLRLMAIAGSDAVGVDVDPLLSALYSQEGDQGPITGPRDMIKDAVDGKVTLVTGSWPSDPAIKGKVGEGFDLIISKNTLKRGYIHPEKEVDKRMLIDLGATDEAFVKAVAESLKPGGFFMIYNLSPAQSAQQYIPWADGRCPFDRAVLEAAGFEVIEFDRDDSTAARAMGAALGWNEGASPMDLENDLFAHYTLLRRK